MNLMTGTASLVAASAVVLVGALAAPRAHAISPDQAPLGELHARLSGGRIKESKRHGSKPQAKDLKGLLRRYRGCILERYETRQTRHLPPRVSGVKCLDGKECSLPRRQSRLLQLNKAVEKGDEKRFSELLRKAVLADCFECSKHRKWHTKHVHCTMDCGGNRGIPQGPCFETCKAGHDFGQWAKKILDDIGKGLEELAKDPFSAICHALLGPLCPVVKIVGDLIKRTIAAKGDVPKAFAGMFEAFKKRIEGFIKKAGKRFDRLFKGLDDVFSMENERQIGPRIKKFAETVFREVKGVTAEFHRLIEMPGIIGDIVGAINGASIVAAVTPPVLLIATINLGARKLMEWLVPKLILGLGDIYGAIEKLPAVVRGIAKTLFDIAKAIVPAASGLLGSFLDKRSKERVQALLHKVADISGKIASGMKGALAVAEQIRTGTFEDVDKALASQAKLPTKLSPQDLGKIIGGLAEFAGDQIWSKLEAALGTLLGKLFKLIDPLLDSARATLVGPVGSIPFVGGVLASVLNVGAGVLVTMGKDFITGKILEFAKKQVDKALESMKRALEKELLGSKQSIAKTENFTKFLKLIGDVAGEISQLSKDVASGTGSVMSVLGSLAATALDKFLLRGIGDGEVRSAVSSAVSEVAKRFGKPGGFDLKTAVVSVLRKIGKPMASLLVKSIQDRTLKALVQTGLEQL